jgi:hypothetical protein
MHEQITIFFSIFFKVTIQCRTENEWRYQTSVSYISLFHNNFSQNFSNFRKFFFQWSLHDWRENTQWWKPSCKISEVSSLQDHPPTCISLIVSAVTVINELEKQIVLFRCRPGRRPGHLSGSDTESGRRRYEE